jgi:hypothetical protein
MRSYRLKLSTVALIIFLGLTFLAFYLRVIGVLGDLEYFFGLVGLIVAAMVVTLMLGRVAKKRYILDC